MDIIFKQCCGLDVHKETVVTTIRFIDDNGKLKTETKTFGTKTNELKTLSNWLNDNKINCISINDKEAV